MSGNFTQVPCSAFGAHLTDTSETTLYTASGFAQVIGVRAANLIGADETLTVGWYSNSDDDTYRLIFEHPVPANSTVWIPFEAHPLREDDEITAQAGSGNALDVVVNVSEIPGRSA